MGLSVTPGHGRSISNAGGGTKPVKEPFSLEETQKAQRNIKTASAPDIAVETEAATKELTTAPKKIKPEARPMAESDVVDQLFRLQKAPTKENRQIISTLLEHGLEASRENFDTIERLIKGKTDKGALDSAVVALTKGVAQSTKTVDILMRFLPGFTALPGEIGKLQQVLEGFKTALKGGGVIDPGLNAGIASVVGDIENLLKKFSGKDADKILEMLAKKRPELTGDLKLFSELLGGVLKQHPSKSQNPKQFEFMQQMLAVRKHVSQVLDNLVSQAILSKESGAQMGVDNFAYWQIPNLMAEPGRHIDLLIKKEKKGKNAVVNPEKTQLILRFETPEMGELGVSMEIVDQKVWYAFYTPYEWMKTQLAKMTAELKDRMAVQNYQLVGVRTVSKKLDLRKYLTPKVNLGTIARVIAEV